MSLGSLPETSLPLLKSAASSSPRSGLANHLRHGSDILDQLIQKDGLVVVGAEYSLLSCMGALEDKVRAVAVMKFFDKRELKANPWH